MNSPATTLPGAVAISTANTAINVSGGPLTLTGVVSDDGVAGLNKQGNGTLVLANTANTYSGPTVIAGGTLQAPNLNDVGGTANTSLGAFNAAPTALVFSGGTLKYTGNTDVTTARGFTTNGGVIDTDKNLTFTGQVLGTNDGADFLKNGLGTLTLSNSTNSVTGVATLGVLGGQMKLTGGAYAFRYGCTTFTPSSAMYLSNATVTNFNSGNWWEGNWGANAGYVSISGTTVLKTEGQGIAISAGAEEGLAGVIDMTGGTVQSWERLQLGMAGGFGVLNVAAGTFHTDGLEWGDQIGWGDGPAGTTSYGVVSVYGTGTYGPEWGTMSDGVTVRSTHYIGLGLRFDGVGILNIGGVDAAKGGAGAGGGTVQMGWIGKGNGTGVVNFHGGLLQVSKTVNDGQSNLPLNILQSTSAYVYGEGAVIDTNGRNAMIAMPLQAPTGNGVTGIPLSAGGSGYNSARPWKFPAAAASAPRPWP